MLKRLLRHKLTQAFLARALGLYLSFALRTTRWTLVGEEHLAPHALGAPAIMAAWHECLALMPIQWMMIRRWEGGRGRRSRIHILISQSRDGRFIGAIIERFGIDVAHGSSSRGGAAALRQMIAQLAAGDHVGITPDGPRGPRRQVTAGVAQLAALSKRADPALRRADLKPLGSAKLGPDGHPPPVRPRGGSLWPGHPRAAGRLARHTAGD